LVAASGSISTVKSSTGKRWVVAVPGSVTAVLGQLLFGPVFVAVVVLESETLIGAGEDPGPGVVVSHVEGDPDLVVEALPDVHHQGTGEVLGIDAPDLCHLPLEGLPAIGLEVRPELVLG
jgi:hypothetical protein